MSKDFIIKWYNKIPEMERDLPILYINGKVYTPNEIYEEVVVKNSNLGEIMQEKLEKMASPYTVSYDDLNELKKVAEERVKRILKMLPDGFSIVSVSGKIVEGEDIGKVLWKDAVEYELNKIIRLIKMGVI